MIDVQIVSGKDPAFVREAIRRVAAQDAQAAEIYVALNHELPYEDEDVQLVRNETLLTFEENHNKLARLGKSPFILFLDDDAFLFEGALEQMLTKMQEDRSVAAVGAFNNQTTRMAFEGRTLPSSATLEEFTKLEQAAEGVARTMRSKFSTQSVPRIFLPGNCLLVRRKVWQKEYGGWDEQYRNWNEEVDFLLWCNERGYRTVAANGVWVFHCHGRSRSAESLLANIVHSAGHFRDKWPKEKLGRLAAQNPALREEINALFNLNEQNSDPTRAAASEYFRSMTGTLST